MEPCHYAADWPRPWLVTQAIMLQRQGGFVGIVAAELHECPVALLLVPLRQKGTVNEPHAAHHDTTVEHAKFATSWVCVDCCRDTAPFKPHENHGWIGLGGHSVAGKTGISHQTPIRPRCGGEAVAHGGGDFLKNTAVPARIGEVWPQRTMIRLSSVRA
ncbi:MAG: hypothetical protein EKK52_15975 [Burkholderiales bacterium]|uniref:hypothetical protein n=1 Tax=Roseateles sp. TaxID=1971397 RepID=UPI000F9B173A|nr:MAG: hypothetical protein EKK52_15975 [Burkholderiales bacterium]